MKSLWNDTIKLPSFGPLNHDLKTDVLIIGGGIAGILIAYFLQQSGMDYILVEQGRICQKTTANTTAKITFQHGLIYHKLIKYFGTEKAALYLNANREAFDWYSKLCSSIECDFEYKDNYVFSVDNRKKIEDELLALEKINYNAEFCRETSLPFKIEGAVKFSNQAQFHPLKFISSISENLNIFENTSVLEMIGNTAVTNRGKIYANAVIVATHFPFINKHGSYFIKLYQHRSYVLALENAQQINGMYVDDDKKGCSFRNYNDILLFGGGSHRTGKKGGNWNELRNKAEIFYPKAKEKYFWSTQDCMSLDDVPYIGRYSDRTQNLFVAGGFNKWGMTGAMVSAILLSDLINGKSNEYEGIFSPSRSVIRPQLFINCAESSINLLSLSKKRCPHLGCALKYNKDEHSWDCPCHGSRFSTDGKLLDNPATGDLK